MPRATPGISTSELHRLLNRWGCNHARDRGGHSIWRGPNGDMLVMPVPGRRTIPTFDQVRLAARSIGVSTEQFLAGPAKGQAS